MDSRTGPPRSRRIGMSKNDYQYGDTHLLSKIGGKNDAKLASKRTKKRSTPPTDASPISSSDEASEPETSLPASKTKAEKLADALAAEAHAMKSDTSQTPVLSTKVPGKPRWAGRSPKRTQDDSGDDFVATSFEDSLFPSSQPTKRRKIKSYGGQRSTNNRSFEEKTQTVKRPDERGLPAFKLPEEPEGLAELLEEGQPKTLKKSFQMPEEMNLPSPKVQRNMRSSHETRSEGLSAGFKVPGLRDPGTFDVASFKMPDSHDMVEDLKRVKAHVEDMFRAPLDVQGNISSSSMSTNTEPIFDHDAHRSSSTSPLSSAASDASVLLSQDHSDHTALESNYKDVARCPVCHAKVDKDFLEDFDNGRRLMFKKQQAFCQAHRKRTAAINWKSRRYPTIEWKSFDQRLSTYFARLERLLRTEEPSFYKNMLEESVRGGERYFRGEFFNKNHDILSAGYYGSRGSRQMADAITSHFPAQLEKLVKTDKLISRSGASSFVTVVLVPELTVMLVKDDMSLENDEEARAVLKESSNIGDLLNKEEDDHVERDEEEDRQLTWEVQ